MGWIIHYHGKNTQLKYQTFPTGNPRLIYKLINQIGESISLEFDGVEIIG